MEGRRGQDPAALKWGQRGRAAVKGGQLEPRRNKPATPGAEDWNF